MTLSHDPLWPRAGQWPPAEQGVAADAMLLGAPTWRTSLSPTGAHATPAAVRDALQPYSATLMGQPPVDLNEVLRITDAGDIAEVDATADAPDARTVRLAALCVLELLAGLAGRRA